MEEKIFFIILLISLFCIALVVFVLLIFVPAPYGRYQRKGWGPLLNPVFSWFLMESPAVFVMLICFITGKNRDLISIIFLSFWEIHYIQRTFIFPLLMKGKGKPWPVSLIAMAFIFNVINGYINGRYLFYFSNPLPLSWLNDPRFLTGTFVFFAGFLINLHSDHILRSIKSSRDGEYGIPRGGFFEFVSGANYFGEIVEWTGWAILTWSYPGLAFALFTAANLVPRAISHHKWYKKFFPDYPAKRKAIIPFIL